MKALQPVILKVPPKYSFISGREKVIFLRNYARKALKICAKNLGIKLEKIEKNDNGSPKPYKGNFWSITHKPGYVGAIITKFPVGIDIEEIKPRSESIFKKVISAREATLNNNIHSLDFFFKVWTAKEAVLKAEGVGLPGLKKCKFINQIDEFTVEVSYSNHIYSVSQFYFDNHIASVTNYNRVVNWKIS